ncbi:3747_t:CDS:2 [Paraglomus occultum]|uniref:3747_t:CDS:1 n=1 Tax=Paraglomus occultum TaxID=144539 RepID=A0A9N8WMP7_9GLOM|nr:3747_t:CDS:2 [Paraglomus occultum]
MDEALYNAHFGRGDNNDGDGISMTPTGSSRGVANEDQENDNTKQPYVRKPPSRTVMITQTTVHFLYTVFNIYVFIILWYLLAYSYRERKITGLGEFDSHSRMVDCVPGLRDYVQNITSFCGADYFYQLLMADISKIVSPYYRFLFLYHVLYLIYTLIAGIAIWFGDSDAARGAKDAAAQNIYLSGIVIWGFMAFKPFVVITFAVFTWIL